MTDCSLGEGSAAAGGDGFGQSSLLNRVEHLVESGKFLDFLRQEFLKDAVGFGLQKLPRIAHIALASEDIPSVFRFATHHLQFEFQRELLTATKQDFIANQVVEIFRVEHQTVHVENDRFDWLSHYDLKYKKTNRLAKPTRCD